VTSPAERYAAAKGRTARHVKEVAAFARLYEFPLDDFQRRSCEILASGSSVLVAAPTGAGKTVVGEFAVHLALDSGQKCFYTTPIKALSNQKYAELVDRYGSDSVGLLTGDTNINSEAPVVVMTTEVLRNMLYAKSTTLDALGYVVMDEVHYLGDRFRGAVWEEVIIHLPMHVVVAALSATVSNAEEFGAWLAEVRGSTEIVVEETRPVPLWQHVMAGKTLYDLFVDDGRDVVNPELISLARREERGHRDGSRGRSRGPARGSGRGRSDLTPWRSDAVERLSRAELLPAIYFLFSRAGCDDAVEQCLRAGLRLTTPAEQRQIDAVVFNSILGLPDEDLAALGFSDWHDGLSRGIGAHHAGMLPQFKETVETLFQRGLLKVVFATETLALGINMPARSVVLERLVKYNGETHVDLSPGEYTQLTGRAGRRGIDVEGHAVVLWQPGIDPAAVAGLASTRTYPLRSSFKPSYNMAVHLVQTLGMVPARELLETSFAQFQADKSVVHLNREVRRYEDSLAGLKESMECHMGDFIEYSQLREELSRLEKSGSKKGQLRNREAVSMALRNLRPGDVINIPRGKFAGPAVVIAQSHGNAAAEPRPLVLTTERQVRRISSIDADRPIEAFAKLRIPKHFDAKVPAMRRDLARRVMDVVANSDIEESRSLRGSVSEDPRIAELRSAIRLHPCNGCEHREEHARWAERYHRAARQLHDVESQIKGRTHTIARQFDRICEVLLELGYLARSNGALTVTPAGRMLSGLYTEADLLVSAALEDGAWSSLKPAELAAVVSAVLFESRRSDQETAPAVPAGAITEALNDLDRTWSEIVGVERSHRVPLTRQPDRGLVWAIYRWAQGASLLTVLTNNDITAGDFVRWTRQVIDLLGQIAQALDSDDPRSHTARSAADLLSRGVIAAMVQND
jgi:ATP-dependent RNA helicase HelY